VRIVKAKKGFVEVLECEKFNVKFQAWCYHDCAFLEFDGKQFQFTKAEINKLAKFLLKKRPQHL